MLHNNSKTAYSTSILASQFSEKSFSAATKTATKTELKSEKHYVNNKNLKTEQNSIKQIY